jgi:hypothetical protein
MSIVLMGREEWVEEWPRTHPGADRLDAEFEFEEFAAECQAQARMEGQ